MTPETARSGGSGSSGVAKPNLPALCEDLLGFAVQLRQAAEPPEEDEMRREVHRLLSELDRQAGFAGVPASAVSDAKYAMVALFDEVVFGSDFPFKESWAAKPLQMELFDDFTAGEEFFRKLDRIRAERSPEAADLLEVYGLCLALGFMGKHAGLQGLEELARMRTEIAREVVKRRGVDGEALAPSGARREASIGAAARSVPVWVIAAAGAGVLLLLYAVLALILTASSVSFPES